MSISTVTLFDTPSFTPLHYRDRAGKEGAEHSARHRDLAVERTWRSADESAGNATACSLHRALEERASAGGLDTAVQVTLARKENRIGDARGVGDGRFEGHVSGHNRTRARGAELGGGKSAVEEEEKDVGLAVSGHVGDKRDLGGLSATGDTLGADGSPERIGDGGLAAAAAGRHADGSGVRRDDIRECGYAVAPAVVLGTDGRLEGRECVEDIISADHVLVGARRKLGRARRVKAGELAANGAFIARGRAPADVIKCGRDGRGGWGTCRIGAWAKVRGRADQWGEAGRERRVGVQSGEEGAAAGADTTGNEGVG